MKRIGVVGIEGAWSTKVLLDEVERKTDFRCLVDLTRVVVDLDGERVMAGETNLTELDALIIRKIGASYSPKFLDRLELLRYVNERGVPVFSRPMAIGRVLDRLSCTVTLRLHDIPMPPTVVTENAEQAAEAIRRFGKAVLKPLYSTKARGMVVVDSSEDVLDRVRQYQDDGHPFLYVQMFAKLPDRDLGVAFMGGRYLGTYARVRNENSWNTTTRSGGRYRNHEPSEHVIELARRAQEPFGLDLTCVDVAECEDGPIVFEVSAFGGFRGLHEGCGIDAARHFVDHVLERISDG